MSAESLSMVDPVHLATFKSLVSSSVGTATLPLLNARSSRCTEDGDERVNLLWFSKRESEMCDFCRPKTKVIAQMGWGVCAGISHLLLFTFDIDQNFLFFRTFWLKMQLPATANAAAAHL